MHLQEHKSAVSGTSEEEKKRHKHLNTQHTHLDSAHSRPAPFLFLPRPLSSFFSSCPTLGFRTLISSRPDVILIICRSCSKSPRRRKNPERPLFLQFFLNVHRLAVLKKNPEKEPKKFNITLVIETM